MDWKNGLTQRQVCETLMNNGQALEFLGKLMEDATKDDHLVAVGRRVFVEHAAELDPSFVGDLGTALVLEVYLRESDKVIVYKNKEVGSLIRFDTNVPSAEGMALVEYLLKLPSRMNLNPAQLHELESLLNKAGESLGIDLPDVRPPSVEEQEAAVRQIILSEMKAKPQHFHQRYNDSMKLAGTPVTMTQKEFFQFTEDTLTHP
jgi:hypothetical protein